MNWTPIEDAISAATGQPFNVESATPVGGGCINEAFSLHGSAGHYFVKLYRATLLDMFEAEAAGLLEIQNSASVRAPAPLCWGENNGKSWLALEYIPATAASTFSHALLGERLALMHRHTADRCGWHRDNYIGETPQPNQHSNAWVEFFSKQRLGFQLGLTRQRGASRKLHDTGQQLIEALPAFFRGYSPQASLLHGDLWSGNWCCTKGGEPVIFDPAVYYGDRETDLAMTELFGGFDEQFYDAYRVVWPIDTGYPVRKTLYNLYHILNHYNLFGGGYGAQAQGMIDRLLAELS